MKKLLLIIILSLFISNCDNNNNDNEISEDTKKIIEQLDEINREIKIKKKKNCLSNLVSSAKVNKNSSDKTSFYIKIENFNQNLVTGTIYLTVNEQLKWSYNYRVFSNEFIEINTKPLPLVSGAKYNLEIGCNVN